MNFRTVVAGVVALGALAACASDPPPPAKAAEPLAPLAASAPTAPAPPVDTRPAHERYHAGDTCRKFGSLMCDDDNLTAYICDRGTILVMPCRGVGGCENGTTINRCDDDLGRAGETCLMTTNENYSCSEDHFSELVCKESVLTINRRCKGPGRCFLKNNLIDCDNTVADVGDPCTTGTYACSTDAATLLHCVSGAFVADNSCRGPNQCVIKIEGTKKLAECDDSIAKEGDPCDEEKETTCSVSHKSLVKCKNAVFVKDKACKHPDGCLRSAGKLQCDN